MAFVHTQDLFSCWIPFTELVAPEPSAEDLEKGARPGVDANAPLVKIGGILSSQGIDFQGETVCQAGIQWDYFLKHGWLNWEHQPGPGFIMGYGERVFPCKDEQGNEATGFEGVLVNDKKIVADTVDTIRALKKGGDLRRIGFSVEGPVIQRDPRDRKRVLKSKVMNVSVTAHPIQPDSRLELLMRSMGANIGYQGPASGGGSLSPLVPQSLGNVAGIEGLEMERRRRSIGALELADMIRKAFPHLSPEQARIQAIHLCNAAPAR
jgi:hypothetical protein